MCFYILFQDRVARELIELRNKSVFAFFMFNALFVLIVFLLQLNKDQIHVKWPLGIRTNITYNEETSEVSIFQKNTCNPKVDVALPKWTNKTNPTPNLCVCFVLLDTVSGWFLSVLYFFFFFFDCLVLIVNQRIISLVLTYMYTNEFTTHLQLIFCD